MSWATTAKAGLVLVLAGAALAFLPAPGPGSGGRFLGCADAAGAHHVAVVAEHGSGAVVTACVGFDSDSLTGEQALTQSGIEYRTAQYSGMGAAVCQVDYEPASYPPSCWSSTSPYWAMFVSRSGGGWATSSLGVSSQTFRDGDALGFRYDSQSGAAAQPPSPAGVCAAASTPAPPPAAVAAAPTPALAAPPPVASRTAAPVATSPAPSAVPTVTPDPTASPSPAALAGRPAGGASGGGLPVGWIAAAAAAVALTGLVAFQALPRLRA